MAANHGKDTTLSEVTFAQLLSVLHKFTLLMTNDIRLLPQRKFIVVDIKGIYGIGV